MAFCVGLPHYSTVVCIKSSTKIKKMPPSAEEGSTVLEDYIYSALNICYNLILYLIGARVIKV